MELSFDLQNQHPLFHCVEDIVNYSNQIDRLEERDGIDASLPLFRYNSEIEEIMKRFTFESPIAIIKPTQTQIQSLQDKNIENFQKTPHEFSIKKQKKIKKVQNSPFHNYQKHLNNALKKLIIVPEFQTHDELYKIIASQIWTVYCRCEIKTKRILHYVFNERNEHVINEPELRTYRLWNIYHSHSQQLISQAKNFLSKLAIDQLDPQNIEGYLKTRKLKSKLGFKQYLLGFRNELQKGYLKRRINGQKLIHDQ